MAHHEFCHGPGVEGDQGERKDGKNENENEIENEIEGASGGRRGQRSGRARRAGAVSLLGPCASCCLVG